jgi:site-specific DNA-methyltransferase (adenine-specific)
MIVETIGDAKLYCGDCLDILPTLDKVDAVVTDPPYGIADKWKGGFGHGWAKSRNESVLRNEWDERPLNDSEISAILAVGDVHIIWGGNYFNLPPSRCWFVWNKPERNFSLAECELAWTSFDNVARVFDCNRSDKFREHPTQKPLALMEWCVSKCKKSKTILDPFMGSGTTGVACMNLGRKFIGIEMNQKYFEIACERIRQAQSQGRLFA